MKILTLGGTGAIGTELADLLTQAGHDVYITTRQIQHSVDRRTYIRGDAKSDTFLKQFLHEPWDVIVDFMVYDDTSSFARRTYPPWRDAAIYLYEHGASIRNSDTLLTERSPRLLDVSEDAQYLSTDENALTKARQENLLRASGKLNWTIIRPYITFGEGRLQLGTLEKEGWLYRALQGRSIVFCEQLMEKSTTLTDSSEVAGMIESLIGRLEHLAKTTTSQGSLPSRGERYSHFILMI